MKKHLLTLMAFLILSFSFGQVRTHSTKVRIKKTPTATATDTLIAIKDDGLIVKTGIAVGDVSGGGGTTPTLQEVTTQGNTTLDDINIGPGANIFGSSLNVAEGVVTTSGNNFPIYNGINKQNPTNNTDLVYGVSNLVEHDGAGNISQLRGVFNRSRSDGTGSPDEMVGILNEISHRNTGSGNVNLAVASENIVRIEDLGGTSSINNPVGVRAYMDYDKNVTIPNSNGIVSDLQMKNGTVTAHSGISIDIDQTGGVLSSGEYLRFDAGIDLAQAQTNGFRLIYSEVDLPSYFEGLIESNITNTEIDNGSGTTLVTKDWVNANSGGSAENLQQTLDAGKNAQSPDGNSYIDVNLVTNTGAYFDVGVGESTGTTSANLLVDEISFNTYASGVGNTSSDIFLNNTELKLSRYSGVNNTEFFIGDPVISNVDIFLNTPSNALSGQNYYVPLNFTDGTATVTSDLNGLVDLSSLSFGGGSSIEGYNFTGTVTGNDFDLTIGGVNELDGATINLDRATDDIIIRSDNDTSINILGETGSNSYIGFEVAGSEVMRINDNSNYVQFFGNGATFETGILRLKDGVTSNQGTFFVSNTLTTNNLIWTVPNASGTLAISATDGTTTVGANSSGVLDLSTLSLGGGGSSPLTTQGDLYVHNGTTDVRLPVGTNGQILEAASGFTEGMRWVTPNFGDVFKVGTPVDGQLGIWTGDGTIEGSADINFTDSNNNLSIGQDDLSFGWLRLYGGFGGQATIDLYNSPTNSSDANIEFYRIMASGINGNLQITDESVTVLAEFVDETGEFVVNNPVTTPQYKLSSLNTAPASATDTGTTGEIRVTATHIYVCTATNTWVRAALSTW